MNITKTTLNFAKRRGLDLDFVEVEDGVLLTFWDDLDEATGEWMFSYRVDGESLIWNGNIYLSQEVKEELPATITSEKHLRQVVEFLASVREMW